MKGYIFAGGVWMFLGVLLMGQMLPNGGFETGDFSGWGETGNAVIVTENVVTGSFAARMTTGDLRATVSTVAGVDYKVTGWVRIANETGTDWGGFRVAVSDYQSWQELGHSGYLVQSERGVDYFRIAFNFTAAAAQSRLQIGYFGGSGRQMIVYVDDFEIEEFDDNEAPVISAVVLDPVDVPGLPALQTFSVTASDPDGAVATIHWDFGDGGRATVASGTRRVTGPGSFTARVTVVDDDGAVTQVAIPWSASDPAWPALNVELPDPDAVLAESSLTISGSASGGGVLISSDRGEWVDLAGGGSFSAPIQLLPGWNRILIQTSDSAGRTTTRERRVRYVPPEPLAIENIMQSTDVVARWETFELAFELVGSAATHPEHPYAAEPVQGLEGIDGITVDALFSNDNWTTILRRPAFWYQPYARELRGEREWMEPAGTPHWRVRFAPPQTGIWQYRIEVQEAKGTAQSAQGSFTVVVPTDPANRGPVRVAQADGRYFEYADGTLYLGNGHGTGVSQERYSYDLIEQLAQIGGGNQQLLRLWMAGHIWGSAWQPWASRTLSYDGTVPPTGLSTAAAYGEGFAAWRLDAENPLLFQGFMSGHAGLHPGQGYRLRVRWRTEGVAGPAQAGAPFGLVVKFTGWPEPGQTGGIPALIEHVVGDTPWHVAYADFIATEEFLPNLALILENTSAGRAYIDAVELFAHGGNGELGPQLLRGSRANQHLTFDQRRGAGMDAMLAAAAAADFQLRLVIAEKQDWLLNHLGPQGFPAPHGGQFFADAGTPGRWLHESYWRHLFARFGASRGVHSWELVNETAPSGGPAFALAARLAALARADANPHPASISTWATLAAETWTDPEYAAIDHADFHAYVRNTGWLGPVEALANDSAGFFHAYDEAVRAANLGKPVVWGEMGIDGPTSTDDEDPAIASDTEGIWLHKLLWARTGPGGVYPLYWWTENIFANSLHGRFGAWNRFMQGIPLNNGRYVSADAVASHADLRVIGQRDTFHGRAHLWIDHRQHTWRNVVDQLAITPVSGTVAVNLQRPFATVQAEWVNTTTGFVVATEALTADAIGTVTLTVANLSTDVAVKLQAQGSGLGPSAGDWPQHQRDAARTGRTEAGVAAPYRARWIWAGPSRTLRNRDSQPGWPDDLVARPGYSYPDLPANSGVSIAQTVQPVIAAGRVFVGSLEGMAFAIGADDGATLWQTALPGPTIATAAVIGTRVIFATVIGEVVALNTVDGELLWTYDTGRAITGAPCAIDGLVLAGSQDGRVHAVDAASGLVEWISPQLGSTIHGGVAAADGRVIVGTEDMVVHALDLADGLPLASGSVRGQSFRMLWPVIQGDRVWISSITTPLIGSEYIGEANTGSFLFADSASAAEEQVNILRWLAGDTNGGRWPDAGADWQRLFALDLPELTQPFTIAAAPADGCGLPVHPPVIDHHGRALSYFKTRYPTLTVANGGVFGTQFSVDISAIDPATGLRQPIDNGRLANPWPWEIDNLFAMAIAGTQLWLRQNFRGTQVIDLADSTARGVSAEIRNRDGGVFNFDVVYRDSGSPIGRPQPVPMGRAAPAIVDGRVYIAEDWGITAIEHRP